MELQYEIKPENLKALEIKQVALDKDKFGALTFDKAYPRLNELRKMLVEFEELGYRELLTTDETNDIENHKNQLINFVQRIHDLNPETDASFNKNVRDGLENEIEDFYRNATKNLRTNLVFLRQEAARKSESGEHLAEQQKAAAQAEQEFNKLAESLKKDLEEYRKQRDEISASRGEAAAIGLGKYFEAQASVYAHETVEWAEKRKKFFDWLTWIITANLGLYIILFITEKINEWPRIAPSEFFTLEYGLVKFALLGLLSYAVGFSTRNLNINAGLVATNKHRKNVAETLANTLASPLSEEAKAILAREAAVAMFQNLSVGYIKKEHQNDSGPILEVIRKISPLNER